MGKIGTWQDAIKSAIEDDVADLPEFAAGSVVLANMPEVKDLDASIQAASRKSKGLALVLFDRSGSIPDVEDDLNLDIELKMQLFISPIKRDLEQDNSLRSADTLLIEVMKFLHGRTLDTQRGHSMDETKVKGFRELADEEFVVFEIALTRRIEF